MRALLLPLGLALWTAPAFAADVRGTATTLLSGRQDPRQGDTVNVVPLYELLSVEATKLELPGADEARLVFNGWGRVQLGEDEVTADHSADLNLLYLEANRGPATLRLGRQHLVLGVGRMELIDGLDARVRAPLGLMAEAFAGYTVHPELNLRTDSWSSGGRLSHNLAAWDWVGEVGASYLQRRKDSQVVRHEVGFDGFTRIGMTNVVAGAILDPQREALVEARGRLEVVPNDRVSVAANVERVTPSLLLPVNSIFTVFADADHLSVGGALRITPTPFWTFDLTGDSLSLDQDTIGYRAALGVVSYREAQHRSAIGMEARRLKENENGYLRGRIFTTLALTETLKLSADVYALQFDEPINDVDQSMLGQFSAVYDLATNLRLAATVAGGSTPWAKSQIEGMLRFAYGYDIDFSREVAP